MAENREKGQKLPGKMEKWQKMEVWNTEIPCSLMV